VLSIAAQGMPAVAVEIADQLLPAGRRAPIALDRVLEHLGRRRRSAGEDVLVVAHGGGDGLLPRRHEQGDQWGRGYSANSHTIPPRLVWRAKIGRAHV